MQNKTICLNAQTWENEHISLSQKLWHKCKKSYPLYPSNMYLLVNLYILILILSSKVEPSAFKYQYWPCSFHSVFKCDVERTHMDEWKSDKINIPLSLPWLAELIWNFQRKACDTLVIYWYVSVCQEHEFYTYLLFGCLRIWPGTHTYMWKKYVMWINFRFLHMTDENKS